MRKIPTRAARLLEAMREDALPRYYDPLKTPEQVRKEACQRLAGASSYVDQPISIGPSLAARIRGGSN